MSHELPSRSGRETLRSDGRGQTLQDFLFGISLFLVTVTLVFGLFPSFLTPFTSGIGAAEKAQADRISRTIVTNLSTVGEENQLNATLLRRVLEKPESELQVRYGLPESAGINITVRRLDGSGIVTYDGTKLATANRATNQSAASSARIITLSNGTSDACRPGCRLVVKVW